MEEKQMQMQAEEQAAAELSAKIAALESRLLVGGKHIPNLYLNVLSHAWHFWEKAPAFLFESVPNLKIICKVRLANYESDIHPCSSPDVN